MIIFFGTPLVDIIAKVDHSFLEKYNLKPDDAVRATPEVEGIFEEILNYNPIIQPGGSVTNTARVFQWTSKKSYPMLFIGILGDDEYGKIIKDKFVEEEITCYLTEIKRHKTGICAVLPTEDYRSLVTHLGASHLFSFDDVDDGLWDEVAKAKYLYLSAFLIRAGFKNMQVLIEHFLKKHDFIILNLGASFLCEKYPKEMTYLFRTSNMVFGNESEYVGLAKILHIQTGDVKEMLVSLNKYFPDKSLRTLVMTRGSKSIVILSNNKVEEFDTEHLEEEKIVDTNGAGDAFVGGYLAQFVRNKSISESVRCGIWAAKEIIRNHGCNFDNKKVYDLLSLI
ncbi:adenosine kinase-like [Anoplophora glabripennis]|uniref:adenosine kinase-like n=1 Tax=Anoplophora glabripennis TaxID=217634 RepID=UPI000873B830|nr:adenosine kinase-like [Anoplophora glabripennis]